MVGYAGFLSGERDFVLGVVMGVGFVYVWGYILAFILGESFEVVMFMNNIMCMSFAARCLSVRPLASAFWL